MVQRPLVSRLKGVPAVFLSVWVLLFLPPRCRLRIRMRPPCPVSSVLKNRSGMSSGDTEGEVGVAIKHVETGRELAVNGDTLFPMASAFKVPILVEVLYQVREGRFGLDDETRVEKTDQHMGSGMLSSLTAPGIVLSVRNLINLMMLISDNSATDLLLAKVGAERVNARLRSLGIEGMSVNRPCQKLIMDYLGMDYAKYGHLALDEITAAR